MPPKKVNAPSKKNVEEKKKKVIEDKTFGLKNKKGAKNQKFIEQVQKQVLQPDRQVLRQQEEKKAIKDAKQKNLEELNDLFKPVIAMQKLLPGTDPKSVLCVYHKQGLCTKGNKCKFSHDLGIERKAAKKNIYEEDKMEEDMNDWDKTKLEEVIEKKHGAKNNGLPPTQIVCKHFIEAVENNKYGWFWECQNGDKCHYKHALPPGYILKKDRKKMEEQKELISIEELIETERMKLGTNTTPVTLETFKAWKRKRKMERAKEMEKIKQSRQKNYKSGNITGISGREFFEFNPDLLNDENEGDNFDLPMREKENDENIRDLVFDSDEDMPEIDEDLFANELENLEI